MQDLINKKIEVRTQTKNGLPCVLDCAIVAEDRTRVLIFKENGTRHELHKWVAKTRVKQQDKKLIVTL